MATRRRRCKKGSLKRPVKTRKGGTRRCKKVKRKTKRRSRSKRKSKRSYKMLALRENTDGGTSRAAIMSAAADPSTTNLKNLNVSQLNILCKMFNIEGCTTRNKVKKINMMRRKLQALKGTKGVPPGVMPAPPTNINVAIGPRSRKLAAAINAVVPTSAQLDVLSTSDLDHLCKRRGVSKCHSKTKAKKVRHIINKLTPPNAGGVPLNPPPANVNKATILAMSTSNLKKLCRALPVLAPCTSIRGKPATKQQLQDKLLVHYRHYVVGNAEVMSASMSKLKRLCTRFGIKKCYIKAVTLDNLRLQVAAHPAVGPAGS